MIIVRLLMQTVALALGQIWANKVRALLTTLGIIIGVAAVISTVAATDGLRKYVLSEFETFGTRKVFMDGQVPRRLRGVIPWTRTRLTIAEIEAIRDRATTLEKITPMYMGAYEVRAGDTILRNVSVTGIWPDWHDIEARFVTVGRPFSSIDEEGRRQVCLVNDRAIAELGLDREPTGDEILIGGRRFMIVGVVETKELPQMFPGGGEAQTELYIPFSTAVSMNPREWVNFALGQLTSAGVAEDAKAEVSFILRQRRGLKPEEEDTFRVEVIQQLIEQFDRVAGAITAGAAGIVAISLLVGGIGIMNIMLVSVSERTREIGLRKAMGARSEVILLQFLVEAVVLCVVGGALGLALGYGFTALLANIPGSPLSEATVPIWAMVLAIGFSALTGVVFGMFPAIKASRLDPIVALRHE